MSKGSLAGKVLDLFLSYRVARMPDPASLLASRRDRALWLRRLRHDLRLLVGREYRARFREWLVSLELTGR